MVSYYSGTHIRFPRKPTWRIKILVGSAAKSMASEITNCDRMPNQAIGRVLEVSKGLAPLNLPRFASTKINDICLSYR